MLDDDDASRFMVWYSAVLVSSTKYKATAVE